jgi:hypothetical protein
MKEQQLRIYKIKPGRLDDWVEAWRAEVVPLREAGGFRILGAWTNEADSEFVWLVEGGGDGRTFAEADAAYMEARAAHTFGNDPGQYAEGLVGIRMLKPVDLGPAAAA